MPFKIPMAVLVGALSLSLGAPLSALAATLSPEAQVIVTDDRPSAELSDRDLRKRLQALRAGLDDTALSDSVRKELRALLRADRAEQEAREAAEADNAAGASTPDEPPAATADGDTGDAGSLADSSAEDPTSDEPLTATADGDAGSDTATTTKAKAKPARTTSSQNGENIVVAANDDRAALDEARKLLNASRSVDRLREPELQRRLSAATRLSNNRSLPANLRRQLVKLTEDLRYEIRQRDTAANDTSAGTVKRTKEQPADVKANMAKLTALADREALKLINDPVKAERLPRAQLRQRLETYRQMLASGNLSPPVKAQLNNKLRRERTLLRERVAVEEVQAKEATTRKKSSSEPRVKVKVDVPAPTLTDAPQFAKDTRRANELNERQLNRRIKAYRVLNRSDRTSAADKARYNERLRADRAELRRRLVEDKRQRVAVVKQQPKIRVNVDLGSSVGVTLWAAEADDYEIERHLTARPVRRIRERYPRRMILERPAEIVTRAEIRESLPSVEIDSINFGFNESFVAEEEIANLDRIGTILERILANNPEEVFLIEGHTDAVGSDDYNLRLSLERARAVKEALIDYYAISPDSLSVVGLGERYLKIQTLDEEQENRRVTVRRMTPLLSEYDPY